MEEINIYIAVLLVFLFIFVIYSTWTEKGEVTYEEDLSNYHDFPQFPIDEEEKEEIYCTFCAAKFYDIDDYHAHLQNKH